MTRWLLLGPMVIGTLLIYFFFSLGFYKPVEITNIENVKMLLLALPHEGAYHKILPTIQKVEAWAKEHDIPCEKTFGEYIDDPREVDEVRLRSFGGCVVAQVPTNLQAPMQVREFSEPRVVLARFFGSPSIGPFKVYPKVEQWLQQNNWQTKGATLEIYIPNETQFMTEFYFPIANKE